MSTEIKGVMTERTLTVSPHDGDMYLVLTTPRGRQGIIVRPADLLAAIEAEGIGRLVPADAIVIERSALPEVDLTSNGEAWAAGQTTQSPEKAHAVALAFLALAEYLTANPPVDEADVEALVQTLHVADPNESLSPERLARALLTSGRVTVTR